MGTAKQRLKGAVEETKGRAKAAVGRATKNRSMEMEGNIEAKKGEVRSKSAKAVARGKGKIERATGRAKRAVGDAVGNAETRAKGTKTAAKGRARNKMNH